MSEARFIVGDVRDVLATLPDASVDLVFTSPPFLMLRSYLPADHPDKAREIGSEPDPGTFIDTLLDITEELARVLAPHGSLCVELGDTYAGHDNRGSSPDEGRHDAKTTLVQCGAGWPLDKSATLVAELYRLSLAYGRNPLTGRETPRWRVRNTIRWCRPNPPVGALFDKFRPATSEIVVACKARDRYFDLDAVRVPAEVQPARSTNGPQSIERRHLDGGSPGFEVRLDSNPGGAPPLDWWKIPTHGYPGAHYATFPPALVTIPLLSMCPEKVCTECGQPSRRIVLAAEPTDDGRVRDPERLADYGGERHGERVAASTTVGWSDCGHDSWRRGVVLDPFGGSGTVAEVATGHGRDAILIDLDERNVELARARIGGLFLTVERH